jgi:hypothetical protein
MSDGSSTLERSSERRRVRWATAAAVVLDLLVPSLLGADAGRHGIGSRLAGHTTFLTAAVGAALWLYRPSRAVGVGLVRGRAAVFVLVLVVMPLVLLTVSTLGFL